MAIKTVRYMASLLNAVKLACKFVPLAATTVRPRIPPEDLAAYDTGVAAIQAFCDFLQTVDLVGDDAGEN